MNDHISQSVSQAAPQSWLREVSALMNPSVWQSIIVVSKCRRSGLPNRGRISSPSAGPGTVVLDKIIQISHGENCVICITVISIGLLSLRLTTINCVESHSGLLLSKLLSPLLLLLGSSSTYALTRHRGLQLVWGCVCLTSIDLYYSVTEWRAWLVWPVFVYI